MGVYKRNSSYSYFGIVETNGKCNIILQRNFIMHEIIYRMT